MVTLDEFGLKYWQDNFLEYLRYVFPLTHESIIIDIGAYQGEFSEKLNQIYGCENFISWEPTDNIHRVKYGQKIQACAWIEDTTVRTNGAYYYTSQIHDNEPGLNNYNALDIARNFPNLVDLIKINIEGAEYDLLRYMIMKELTNRCKYLQIQFHQTDKFDYQSQYDSIFKQLRLTHNLMWRVPFVWEAWKIKDDAKK